MSEPNTIAIIGAGQAGASLLSILIQIPGIRIKYVSDINPDAPGIALAKKHDIEVHLDPKSEKILKDPAIDMIFEVTGKEKVFNHLQNEKMLSCNIMCSSMAKIIFYLLNSQQDVAHELREYKLKLAERVIERTDELERVNYKLKEQIDLQHGLNEKLQTINNEKTKYLLNATHQLKAPFAAIQSYVDILIEGYSDSLSEKVLTIMNKIKSRCELLTNSIRRMLELANLNSVVEENISKSPEKLNGIIKKVISDESGILEKRNISIIFTSSTENDQILCNKDQIETMLTILIDNAVNYSPDDSKIEITLDLDSKKRIIFNISDSGIGIEEKNLRLIFNEYYRTYRAADKFENGSGLGLSIARRIARLHQTDIFVDSNPGVGSTFMIPFESYKGISP